MRGSLILNLHPVPAPVLQFCIRRFGASAGVYFSSVSTGKMQNQIRLYDSSGIEFDKSKLDSVNEFVKQNKIFRAKPLDVGSITDIPHTQDIYKRAIPHSVNRDLIKNKGLHVVVDCSYGPGSIVLPAILTNLKVDVIAINAYENDLKSTEMYPNLQSIKDVVNIVKASNADLGIVLDTDGSRALYIDETGKLLNFEELMMFFLKYEPSIINAKEQPIVTTETASKIVEQFALESGGYNLIRTRNYPGEISRSLREERGIFGGSETMKFYFPAHGPFSDATYTTIKILEILSREQVSLSVLIRPLPRTVHAYKSLTTNQDNMLNFKERLRKIIQTHLSEKMDYQDIIIGMKIITQGIGWVAITPSIYTNTIELEAEGVNAESSEKLIQDAEQFVLPIL